MNQNQWGNSAQNKRKNRWEDNEECGKRAKPSVEDNRMWPRNNDQQRRGPYGEERAGGRYNDNRGGGAGQYGHNRPPGGQYSDNRQMGGQFNDNRTMNRQYNNSRPFGGHYNNSRPFGDQGQGEGGSYEEQGPGDQGARMSGASQAANFTPNTAGGPRPLMGIMAGQNYQGHDQINKGPLTEPPGPKGSTSGFIQAKSQPSFGPGDNSSFTQGGNNRSFSHTGNDKNFGQGVNNAGFGQERNIPGKFGNSGTNFQGRRPPEAGARTGFAGPYEEGGKGSGNFGSNEPTYGSDATGAANFDNGRNRGQFGSGSVAHQDNFGYRADRTSQPSVSSPSPSRASHDERNSQSKFEKGPLRPNSASSGERVNNPPLPEDYSGENKFPSQPPLPFGSPPPLPPEDKPSNQDPIVTLRKMCEDVDISPQFTFYDHKGRVVCMCDLGTDALKSTVSGDTREEAQTRAAIEAIQRFKEHMKSEAGPSKTNRELETIAKLKVDVDHSKLLSHNATLLSEINSLKAENVKLQSDNQKFHTDKEKLQSENKKLQSDNQLLQSEKKSLQDENKNIHSEKERLEKEVARNKEQIKNTANNEKTVDKKTQDTLEQLHSEIKNLKESNEKIVDKQTQDTLNQLHSEIKTLKESNRNVMESNKKLKDNKQKACIQLTNVQNTNKFLNKEIKNKKETIAKLEKEIERLESTSTEPMEGKVKSSPTSNGRLKIPKMNECSRESCQVARREFKKLEKTNKDLLLQVQKMENEIREIREVKRKQEDDFKRLKDKFKRCEEAEKKLSTKCYDIQIEKNNAVKVKTDMMDYFSIEGSKIHLQLEVEDKSDKIANCERQKSEFEEKLSSLELEAQGSNKNSDLSQEIKEVKQTIDHHDQTRNQLVLEKSELLSTLVKIKRKVKKFETNHAEIFGQYCILRKKYDLVMQLRDASSSGENKENCDSAKEDNVGKQMFIKYNALKDVIKWKNQEILRLSDKMKK